MPTCPVCRTDFAPAGNAQRYCSPACQRKSWRSRCNACPRCGARKNRTSKMCGKCTGNAVAVLPPPSLTPEPTTHPPGSPGKLAVLIARAAAGEVLWHPDDARA